MKLKCIALAVALCLLLPGCTPAPQAGGIAATTLPVYQFTLMLCQGTNIPVTRLVTESVSCLHDYTLKVSQVKAAEAADVIVITGAGMEDFMADVLQGKTVIDGSQGIPLLEGCHEEGHEGHHHEEDPHYWLSPENACRMAQTICSGLMEIYPDQAATFQANLSGIINQLEALQRYGREQLSATFCRELVTFHDGFAYLAHSLDLEILEAIEEESGSEASARELIDLIGLVNAHQLPAIFTEENGSVAAAEVISRETGTKVYTLSMCLSGDDYFAAMYRNIDTLKEALR